MKLRSLLFAVSFAIFHLSALAQTDKVSDIKNLMISTGMSDMTKQIMVQMVNMQKQSNPEVPEEFWTKFMDQVDTDELISLMVPIYDKYYTQDEIKELTAFYQTDIGKKTISVMPSLMQESMMVGQKWGMELGQKIATQIETEGY